MQVGCTSAKHWVVASGFLDKCRDGAVRVGWSRRFFVLSPTALFYFRRTDTRNELFGEERGRFPLSEILEIQFQADEYDPTHPLYNIIIKLQRRETQPLRLRSDSRAAAESWIQLLEQTRDLSHKMQSAPLVPSPERQLPDENTLGFRLMSVVPQGVGLTLDENRIDILATSYLEKARDGAVRSGWAVRFFVLTHTSLQYYRRSDPRRDLCGEERGKILISDIQNLRFDESGPYFNLEITTARKDAKKMLVLRTQHQQIWQDWQTALNNVVETSGRLSVDSRGSPYSPAGTPSSAGGGAMSADRGNSFSSRARSTSSPKSVMDIPEVPLGAPQVVAYTVKTNQIEKVLGYRAPWGSEITVEFPATKGSAAANLVLSEGGIAKVDQSVIAHHSSSAQKEFKVSLASNGKLRLSCRPGVASSSADAGEDDTGTGGMIAAVKQAVWGAISGSFISAVAVLVQAEWTSTNHGSTVYLVAVFGLILALYVLLTNTVLSANPEAAGSATDKKTCYRIKLITWEPPAGYLAPNASTPLSSMSLAAPRRVSGGIPVAGKSGGAEPAHDDHSDDPGYMQTNAKFPPPSEKNMLMKCCDFPNHIVLGESVDP
jgi:hypothetical protein